MHSKIANFHSMGARRHGQGASARPHWKYCKVLFVLQMLSKVSFRRRSYALF